MSEQGMVSTEESGTTTEQQDMTTVETTTTKSVGCDDNHLYKDDAGCSSHVTEKHLSDSSSCSSCSTRRNSLNESDFEITINSLFRTPSSTSTSDSSSLGTPSLHNPSSSSHSNVLDGIDVLLQRITSERFTELRSIQLSDRPVTGGVARGNIDSFFRRAIHGPTDEEREEEEAANRPAHVADERELLQQQSLVRSSLQNDFRDLLERTIAARMPSSLQALPRPQQNQPRPPRPQQVEGSLVGGSDFRSRLESLYGGRSTGAPAAPIVRRRRVPITPQNPVPEETHQPQQQQQSQQQSSRRVRFAPATEAMVLNNNNGDSNTTTETVGYNNNTVTSSFGITFDAGLQLLAQNIVDDLNTLQSLQVVSNMLRGDFRNDLETMVQSRIDNDTGPPNQTQTQEFVRSLPGRRPIEQQQQQQQYQHQQQQPQSFFPRSQAAINSGVTAELGELKSQMDEMKRMLAMSMEIQMDTQRAIRQEVSAIFSSFMQSYQQPRATTGEVPVHTPIPSEGPVHTPTLFAPPISTPVCTGQCVICIENTIDTVLYTCGHMCCCNQCGMQLKIDGQNCPMCRAPIRDVIRAYQTQ